MKSNYKNYKRGNSQQQKLKRGGAANRQLLKKWFTKPDSGKTLLRTLSPNNCLWVKISYSSRAFLL